MGPIQAAVMSPAANPDRFSTLMRGLNSARVRGRSALVDIANLFGGDTQNQASQEALHEIVSQNLTSKLGTILPPQLAANVADMAGLGNETISGGLQALLGNPFESETGFDWADVTHNRIGQDRAMRTMETQPPGLLKRGAQELSGLGAANALARLLAGYRGE